MVKMATPAEHIIESGSAASGRPTTSTANTRIVSYAGLPAEVTPNKLVYTKVTRDIQLIRSLDTHE